MRCSLTIFLIGLFCFIALLNITACSDDDPISPDFGPISSFVIDMPEEVDADGDFELTITAMDDSGLVITNYDQPVYVFMGFMPDDPFTMYYTGCVIGNGEESWGDGKISHHDNECMFLGLSPGTDYYLAIAPSMEASPLPEFKHFTLAP